jgi:spore germination cell wall hydrolase CwlJ-like protein
LRPHSVLRIATQVALTLAASITAIVTIAATAATDTNGSVAEPAWVIHIDDAGKCSRNDMALHLRGSRRQVTTPPTVTDGQRLVAEGAIGVSRDDKQAIIPARLSGLLANQAADVALRASLRGTAGIGTIRIRQDAAPPLPASHSKESDRLAGVPPILADLVTNDSADVLATGYAPTDPSHPAPAAFESLFSSGSRGLGRFIPPKADGDPAWMQTALPAGIFSENEQNCLARAVYFEARGESLKGQAAVAQVVLNRVRNPAYPDTACAVVYQNSTWLNRCQFSFACDGNPDIIDDQRAWRLARDIAMAVAAGKIFLVEIGSSTHYYANYVSPSWARSMRKSGQIGKHLFYRTYGGGWA